MGGFVVLLLAWLGRSARGPRSARRHSAHPSPVITRASIPVHTAPAFDRIGCYVPEDLCVCVFVLCACLFDCLCYVVFVYVLSFVFSCMVLLLFVCVRLLCFQDCFMLYVFVIV